MADTANYVEVQRALTEGTETILRQIPVRDVLLSLPLDGRGARIRASVRPADRRRVPTEVQVVLDGRPLTIRVEAEPDYTEAKAL